MNRNVWSIALDREESEALLKIFEGFTKTEVLRAALDLLIGVAFVRPIDSKTISVIWGARSSARKKGMPVPFCERVCVTLKEGKMYCH